MDIINRYEIHLKGVSPLIMCSDKLCDPLNEDKKKLSQLTSLKRKTDEHHKLIDKIMWEGNLCYEEDLGIYVPTKWVRASIQNGAKKNRNGRLIVGVVIDEPIGVTIKGYKKTTPEMLWNILDKKGKQIHVLRESAVVKMARIMISKPIINSWEISFKIELDTEIFPFEQFKLALFNAGRLSGIGGMRPERGSGSYGRFIIENIKEIEV